MRTTITLDKDVAARLDHAVRRRKQSFKKIVNDALRAGLKVLEEPSAPRRSFRTRGFDAGPSLVGSLVNIEDVLARVEGDHHR